MRCIVHIGTEKTGTTTLQRWLYANREVLSGQGYFLSDVAGVPNNRDLCALFQQGFDDYFRALGVATAEDKNAHFAGFAERFGDEIEAAAETHDTVILLSEHFSSRLKSAAEIEALRDFLARHFDELEVVCYLREQSELIRSLYSTALLSGSTQLSLAEFYEVPSVDEPFFNYTLMLAPWRRVFGPERVHVRIYAKTALADGDIRRDFTSEFLPSVSWDSLAHEEAAANQSMSLLQSVLIRFLNAYLPRFLDEGGLNDERSELVNRVLGNPRLRAGRLSKQDAAEIYTRFDAANRELARAYLGADRNPFAPPSPKEAAADQDAGFNGTVADELVAVLEDLFDGLQRAESAREPGQRGFASIPLEVSIVDFLRDVAFKYETSEPLSRAEALRLMRWAQRGRPDGFYINRFIEQHSGS